MHLSNVLIKKKYQEVLTLSCSRYLACSDSTNSLALLGPENELTANDHTWTTRQENLG